MSLPILRLALAIVAVTFAAGFIAAPARAVTPVAEAGALAFKSVSVELPGSDRPFPPGPGVDVMGANCAGCHSPGMILNQPSLSRAAWEAEVKKMINVYKAPVDAADIPAIVAYLAATKSS